MIVRTLKQYSFRPRMVVAYADSAHAALSARHFRRLGWEVHLASSGPDARRIAQDLTPEVVVLDTQFPDESGWLTCAKMMLASGAQKVVLVSAAVTPEESRLADTVGAAAVVNRNNGVPVLVHEVMAKALPNVG
jgi:two-component system, OmpR family, response regulator